MKSHWCVAANKEIQKLIQHVHLIQHTILTQRQLEFFSGVQIMIIITIMANTYKHTHKKKRLIKQGYL